METQKETDLKVPLTIAMLHKADKVLELLKPENVDVEFVAFYEKLASEEGKFDALTLDQTGAQFLRGFDMCKDAAAVCRVVSAEAKRRLDRESALATLERSETYFLSKAIKPTDNSRKAYVDLDEEVNRMTRLFNDWKILAEFFEKSMASCELWHNWVKKLFDQDNGAIQHAQKPRL